MIVRRILAFWIDFFLSLFLSSAGLFLLRREILAGTDPDDYFNPLRRWAEFPFHPFFLFSGIFLYFLLFLALLSETPGLSLFGLTLIRSDDEPSRRQAGFRRSLVRVILLAVNALFLGLGFLVALMNDRRMTLHDCLSGTRIVRERSFLSQKPAESA